MMTLDELYEAQRSSSHSNTTDSNISSSESDDKKNITYTVVANKEHGGKTEVCTAEYIPEAKKLSKEEQNRVLTDWMPHFLLPNHGLMRSV